MKVRVTESTLRLKIRQHIICEAAVGDSGVQAVISAADALAQKLAGMGSKEAGVKLLKSDAVKKLQEELADALAAAGVEEMTPELEAKLMDALQAKMKDDVKGAEVEGHVEEYDDYDRQVGDEWVRSANELGNAIEWVGNAAALVFLLPFVIVAGAAREIGRGVKKARMVTNEDQNVMFAAINGLKHNHKKPLAWVEKNRDKVDQVYKKYKGLRRKLVLKHDKQWVEEFLQVYEDKLLGKKMLPAAEPEEGE